MPDQRTPSAPCSDNGISRQAADELLDRGRYDELAELLQRAMRTCVETEGASVPYLLGAAQRICEACDQLHSDVAWHRTALETAIREELALREQLQALIALIAIGASAPTSEELPPLSETEPSSRVPDGTAVSGLRRFWQQLLAPLTRSARDSRVSPSAATSPETAPSEVVGSPDSPTAEPVTAVGEPTTGCADATTGPTIAGADAPPIAHTEMLAPPAGPPEEGSLDGAVGAVAEIESQPEQASAGSRPAEDRLGPAVEEPTVEPRAVAGAGPLQEAHPQARAVEEMPQRVVAEAAVEPPAATATGLPQEAHPQAGSGEGEGEVALLLEQTGGASPVVEDVGPAQDLYPLVIYCLGPFRVYQDDQSVEDWRSSKGTSVFKYLVTHRERPVAKAVLMELFWPGATPDAARNNLNVAIYSLRQALREGRPAYSHVLFQDDCYLLNPDLQVWIDVEAFEARLQTARNLERCGDLDGAMRQYRAAEALYQGEFLEEDRYEDWLIPRRRGLQDAYLGVLARLSRYYFDSEDYAACAAECGRMLAGDACCEDAHRRLMRCYSRQGQAYLALRQYHMCMEALRRELDVPPSPETTELFEHIRRRERI